MTELAGAGVLKDFPLRLWAESRQHTDEVLREFSLLLEGERSGQTNLDVPQSLVALADMFTSRYGPLIDDLNATRERAIREGADRMDSVVPLPVGAPQLFAQAKQVLETVDEYCRGGDLLVLERSPQARRLFDWTVEELARQYEGGEPTPWPGPF